MLRYDQVTICKTTLALHYLVADRVSKSFVHTESHPVSRFRFRFDFICHVKWENIIIELIQRPLGFTCMIIERLIPLDAHLSAHLILRPQFQALGHVGSLAIIAVDDMPGV